MLIHSTYDLEEARFPRVYPLLLESAVDAEPVLVCMEEFAADAFREKT